MKKITGNPSIFTNWEHDILFGVSGRVYIPITWIFSIHAEGGILIDEEGILPHVGGGISVYADLDEMSEFMLIVFQLAPKILFLPNDQYAAVIQISLKFCFF